VSNIFCIVHPVFRQQNDNLACGSHFLGKFYDRSGATSEHCCMKVGRLKLHIKLRRKWHRSANFEHGDGLDDDLKPKHDCVVFFDNRVMHSITLTPHHLIPHLSISSWCQKSESVNEWWMHRIASKRCKCDRQPFGTEPS